MQNFFLIMTGMAFGAILLVVLKLMLDFRQVLTARLLSLLLISAACYMVQPFVDGSFYLELILGVAAMSNPALFWMFSSTLFQSDNKSQKLHVGHYIGLVASAVLAIYQCFQMVEEPASQVIHITSLILTSVLTILGLMAIFRSWQSDLVECRRWLRAGLSVASGAFLLFIVINEFIYGHGELPAFLNYLNVVVIAFFALAFGYIILVSNTDFLLESIDELTPELVKAQPFTPSAADKVWLQKLTHTMETELYYQQVDLTIKSLSEHLVIPEHQLRKLINQHLGYRNFNDYLNRYRIKAAAERLADPRLVRTPILTIAIESGYASLTTFNKAFKALKEMTPSEFRRISGLSGTEQLTDY